MTCRELVELVTDYLEGALSAGERERVDAHLERCLGCEQYVEQIREVVRLARRAGYSSSSRSASQAL